jgi:hypothetical protein
MKKTETREETLARLAKSARKAAGAAKRFEALIKRAARTPAPAAKPKATNRRKPKARNVTAEGARYPHTYGQTSILMPMQRTAGRTAI